jgi:hypothetical protein
VDTGSLSDRFRTAESKWIRQPRYRQ